MLVDVVANACVVTHELIHLGMRALDGLLAVQTHCPMRTGEARNVNGQLMHLESDGLTGEVFMKFGAKRTTLLREGIDLLWGKKTVCSVEFVAGGEQLEQFEEVGIGRVVRDDDLAITKECVSYLDLFDGFQHLEVKRLFPPEQSMHLRTSQCLIVILVEGETMLGEEL